MPAAVHVALASVLPAEAVVHLLDADERERAGRRATRAAGRAAGDASATSAALLRHLLSALTGVPPQTHAFTRRCGRCGGRHGKPELRGALHTSRSAAGGIVAAAVTAVGPVGVDVERQQATGFAGFAGVALHPSERADTGADRARTWTRKEAVLKAAGVGLSEDPRALELSPPQAAPLLLAWPAAPGVFRLLDVPAPSGTACSAAVLTDLDLTLVLVDGDALLRA